jgi:hypothetical protein
VLFKLDSGKNVNVQMPWIAESGAQKILQQIGGFDPVKAPFVFEDTYVKLGGSVENLYQNNKPVTFRPSNTRLLWLGGVVMLLISVTWYVVRKKR